MSQKEFETRTGLSVTEDEYAKIEQFYLNADSMDKDAFCKAWKSAKGKTLELIEELSNNVDGKRSHINRLNVKIQNLVQKLEMETERNKLRGEDMDKLQEANDVLEVKNNVLTDQNAKLAIALIKAGLEEQTIAILGHGHVISLKCSYDIELNWADKAFLSQAFSE